MEDDTSNNIVRRRRRSFFLLPKSLLMDLKSYSNKDGGGVSSNILTTVLGVAVAATTVFAAIKAMQDREEEDDSGVDPDLPAEDQPTDEGIIKKYEEDEELAEARPILDPAMQDGRFPIDPEEQKEVPILDALKSGTDPLAKEKFRRSELEADKGGVPEALKKEPEPAKAEPVKVVVEKPKVEQAPMPQTPAGAPKPEVAAPKAESTKKPSPQDRYKFEKRDQPEPKVAKVAAQLGPASATLVSQSKSGPRHKYKFEGFSGADTMSRKGAYTEEEAKTIVGLKSRKEFTGALHSGIPPNVMAKIEYYAKKHGVSLDYMVKTATIESGGNQNAISFTGAIGIYQFVGKTATSMGVKDRFDLDQNIEGGALLAKSNKTMLPKEYQNDPTALYLIHQLGPKAALEVLRNSGNGAKISDLSPFTIDALSKNYGGKSTYVAEYLAMTKAKIDPSSVERTQLALKDVKKTDSKPRVASKTAPAQPVAQATGPAQKPQDFVKVGNKVIAV